MTVIDPSATELLEQAFRDVHGSRLHGFALLLTLGDRPTAARLANEALAEARPQLDGLRHPERAAAWLRARVTRAYRQGTPRTPPAERAAALQALGLDAASLAGLAALARLERAALVASGIERLDQRDVATIVGRDGRRLEALLRRARRRYLTAATEPDVATPPRLTGIVGQRVHAVAARTLS